MENPLVIYHGNCADGFTAAWCVRKAYPNADFFAGFYGENPPDVSGRKVIIVDFSYKKDILLKMSESAKSIIILDHHVSAQNDLKDIKSPKKESPIGWIPDSGVYALFDMERSGARLAWDWFVGGIPNFLVKHVEDRDLWRFRMEQTKAFQANLFSYEYTFDNWDRISHICADDYNYWNFVYEGEAILRKQNKDIAEFIKATAHRIILNGVSVPAINCPYMWGSDACHIMAQGEPFAAYYYNTDIGTTFGLRSADDGMDVSEIAKIYGGGGHKNAAGFKLQKEFLLKEI